MAKVAAAKKLPMFVIGAGGASLTNEDCTAYSVQYVYNTTALANGTATAILAAGGKTWFYLTADYAFGTQLQSAASKVVEAKGGRNLGAVRVPLSASDFASFLLQAQGSGAQVLGLANAGDDFTNSLKAANEFGLTRTMKPAGLLVAINNIHSLGLEVAQGLYLTTAWYWDLNPETRAFAKRYFEKMLREPTMYQAGFYSATMTYLNAVKVAGTTDAHTRRRPDGARHVCDAGQVAAGIQVPLGLLQSCEGHEGRRGVRPDHWALPSRPEVVAGPSLIGLFC
jgi:branched-chain amino acid transport system substrate-binding protein